jgi:hypothetical protein
MNAPVTASESAALAPLTEAPPFVTQSTSTVSLILNPEHMAHMFKFAEMMACGVATVPKHLQKNPADCLAVVMQATQWGMNPFAVAQKTHIVNGTLGYEAQLVNAVLQATGAIEGDFTYEYKGDKEIECRVGAIPKGSKEITWGEWLSSATVTTKNSPLWKTNVKQQMGYLQVKNWARAFKPAALLGVYTPEELETMPPKDITPGRVDGDKLAVWLAKAEAATTDAEAAAVYQDGLKDIGTKDLAAAANLKAAVIAKRKAIKEASATDVQPKGSEAPAGTSTAADTNPPIEMTFAKVMDMLIKAKNRDALDVAADWIGEVQDPEQRKELSAKYDELVAAATK